MTKEGSPVQAPRSLKDFFAERAKSHPESKALIGRYQPLTDVVSNLTGTTLDEQVALFVHQLWIADPIKPKQLGFSNTTIDTLTDKFQGTVASPETERYDELFRNLEEELTKNRIQLVYNLSDAGCTPYEITLLLTFTNRKSVSYILKNRQR